MAATGGVSPTEPPRGGRPDPAPGEAPRPRVVLPATVREQLRVRAEGAYPEECCGLLIGLQDGASVLVRRELPCPNAVVGSERRRRFVIHPKALLNVMRALQDHDESVVGFYHSHPDASADLSPTDLTFVGLWPDTVWLVMPVGEEGAGEEKGWWLPSVATAAEAPPLELRIESAPESGAWS